MNNPALILRQNNGSVEVRTVAMAGMLENIPTQIVGFRDLPGVAHSLRRALPVGSVEFVRECMRLAGVDEPVNLSYPKEIARYFRREVQQSTAGAACAGHFVKPLQTKAWTGFVLREDGQYDDHDREQYNAFAAMPKDEPVWISERVEFVSEWRYYVRERKVIGCARYDPDGLDDAPTPDNETLQACIDSLPFEHPYALDLGVLSTGETAVVEVNDAWSIGLYGRALESRQYLSFLWERWSGMVVA